MGNLTKNFSRSEFACKGQQCCGHSAPINPDLVDALQLLRDRIGTPLIINSGFRCIKHNTETPEAAHDSQHCLGLAADVALPIGVSIDTFLNLARSIYAFSGIGIGISFLHLDIGRPQRIEWTY